MLLEAVYHRAYPPFVYMYDKDCLHIHLRTKKQDIQSVKCYYGDPFLWENGQWKYSTIDMYKSGCDDLFDYWLVSVKTKMNRLRYGFQLYDGKQFLFYTEQGFFKEQPTDIGPYFCFPYLHEADTFKAPDWVKDTVWYQIFPERFHNGSTKNDPKQIEKWGQTPKQDSYFGGDVKGIIDRIDYLKELGITGIYLTPIFQAKSNHKYDTIDYFQIDPQFGDKNEFKQLVNVCHEHGIKVMLDAVFNHCGFEFPPFQDVLQKGEQSPYKDWFFIREFPVQTEPHPNYETFAFEKRMPKFNTSNPEVKEYLLKVATYWIEQYDIDGWRLDVANEIDHTFWREFRKKVKEIKKDMFIVGEVWHDAIRWLLGDQFDSVMNYPLTDAMRQYFLTNEMKTKQFISTIERNRHTYQMNINEVLFNIAGSHDTERIATAAQEHTEKLKLLFAFLFSYPGTPCLYYGDEIGLTGGQDPDCRKCMPWDLNHHEHELFLFVKKLIQLRKQHALMGNKGTLTFHPVPEEKEVVLFTKTDEKNQFIFILNNSDQEQSVTLPFSLRNTTLQDVWTEDDFAANAETLNITIPPYSFQFLLEKGKID
ncbi:alpha-glycosidase [Bacillus sp. FJAT-47783]|uniref:alpha-glycosidase n=1 Tax=Bacillus sp. FJAT-47783 TaxID=2922712 RepID=UPI001FACD0D1|nr:alpha-glycosidase [Bacillus sp. FJAT-47783]